MPLEKPPIQSVIGLPVTALPFQQQVDLMVEWASRRLSRTVCVANVHMLMEARTQALFARVLQEADLVTPDGMPLVWLLHWLGYLHQDRVAGMDIFLALGQQLSQHQISIFFLGSEVEVLRRIRTRLSIDFPRLPIAGMEALPFRPLTVHEDAAIVRRINRSGAGLVVVSLGCPKQELWMHRHRGKIQAVMVGLGAVFTVYAGLQQRAPLWMRESGLEWLFRLIQEPRRLWWRYLSTIPPFMILALHQLLLLWLWQEEIRVLTIESAQPDAQRPLVYPYRSDR